jgi:arsenate reductase-like glutaredoxin family protein
VGVAGSSGMTIAGTPLPPASLQGSSAATVGGIPRHSSSGSLSSPQTTRLYPSTTGGSTVQPTTANSNNNNNPTTQQLIEQTNTYQQQLSVQTSTSNNTNDELKWLPVEDDIIICMQNAIHDPNFSHTMHWLNNAKGIVLKTSRTVNQAKNRYAYLCSIGKKDERLLDPNVIRTIAKLKKSIKRPIITENSDGTTTAISSMNSSNAPGVAGSLSNPSSGGTTMTGPTIGMSHAIEKKSNEK